MGQPRHDRAAGAGRLRIAGHFGEFLQGRLGPAGPLVLVTLPCAAAGVVALHRPAPALRLQGDALRPDRARAMLAQLGAGLRGRVLIRALDEPGGGTGTSTAALLALARLAGQGGRPPQDLARAALAVEGASDPLMFPAPGRVLWASREGRALACLPPLPAMQAIGGLLGPPCRTRPQDMRYPDISDLVARWQAGPGAAEAARLASQSAARTLALRGPAGDPT
ncbi:propanediol utilization protein, partial [Mangrovicoccus algicola]